MTIYHTVTDFGAKGDGVTDDTDAIQTGINFLYQRGGGTLYFPFTPTGYRLAKPAPEEVNGFPCRSQLYIPCESDDIAKWRNIRLLGEMPVAQLHAYQLVMGGEWPKHLDFSMEINNVCLISDWEAPEERDRNARPWALLAVLGGHKLRFGFANLTIENLEFRVFLGTDRMYPTSSAVNCMSTSRLIIEHSYFGLSKNVGSVSADKELLANPCHTAGVITSAHQNDHQVFRSVGVQGFRYGFVFGEHVKADMLYIHNCEEGLTFHGGWHTHYSSIDSVVAQHCRVIISALRENLFGRLLASQSNWVRITGISYEPGHGTRPVVYQMQYGVFDPDNRLTGEITHHCGYPMGMDWFCVFGGQRLLVRRFGDHVPMLSKTS